MGLITYDKPSTPNYAPADAVFSSTLVDNGWQAAERHVFDTQPFDRLVEVYMKGVVALAANNFGGITADVGLLFNNGGTYETFYQVSVSNAVAIAFQPIDILSQDHATASIFVPANVPLEIFTVRRGRAGITSSQLSIGVTSLLASWTPVTGL